MERSNYAAPLYLQLPVADPLAVLERCITSGFARHYWIYRSDDECRIALDAIGEVVLEDDIVRSFWAGQLVARDAARDPFLQFAEHLSVLTTDRWRAFGYIMFDAAAYYYPYPLRSAGALARFVIPRVEIAITPTTTSVCVVDAPEMLIPLIKDASIGTYRKANAPPLDSSDRASYEQRVNELLVDIKAGALRKAIISRCVTVPASIDLVSTFHNISETHDSTGRAFAFKQPGLAGVGLSPELLMHTSNTGSIVTTVLAGTRPRGKSESEDQQLRRELEMDAKEIKEHGLSVTVAEQELASVCGVPVAVSDLMRIVSFPTVHHLSSTVRGQLADGRTLWDGLKALFPAVTVSGADKYSAIERIASLEQRPRGAYAGAIGWVDSDGMCDLAIALRSAFEADGGTSMCAGAGIVAESTPWREYEETVHKLKTIQERLVLQ
jgi:salicylate synthetase